MDRKISKRVSRPDIAPNISGSKSLVKLKHRDTRMVNAALKDINSENKHLKSDFHRQEFSDMPYQSYRLAKDAEREAVESEALSQLQENRAGTIAAKIQNKQDRKNLMQAKNKLKSAKRLQSRQKKWDALDEKQKALDEKDEVK